jgi:hypothetical protein
MSYSDAPSPNHADTTVVGARGGIGAEAEQRFAEMLESDSYREYYFMSRAVTHGVKSARIPSDVAGLPRARGAGSPVPRLVSAQPDDGIRRLYDAINSEKVLAEFRPLRPASGATAKASRSASTTSSSMTG